MEQLQAPVAQLPDQPGLLPNRACRACVQIKAKCVPRGSDLSTCERCHRLGKECTTPAPRKRARKQPAEIAELRERVDSLTRALVNQQHQELSTPAPSNGSHDTPQRSQEDEFVSKSI